MRSWFFHPGAAIAGGLGRLLFGLRLEGVERVPRDGAFIVVANHCSNFDPPLIGYATGHQVGRVVNFMAKIEMRGWPVIGWLATQSGVFFVRRGEGDRAAQRFSLEALATGRPIAIFPEGTRSRNGHLTPGKPGAALVAMRSGAALLPVAIAGSHRIFPGRSRWPRPTKLRIRVGAPFALPYQPTGRLARGDLASGTQRIMAEIAALLPAEQQPVAGSTPADAAGGEPAGGEATEGLSDPSADRP